MKRWICVGLTLLLTVALCACRNTSEPEVDLNAFYQTLCQEYTDLGELMDMTGEMQESYYPGLEKLELKQKVAKLPELSSEINEYVFLRCATAADASQAATILQARIRQQVEGGAWYPEMIETWKTGKVITQGTYVALIVSSQYQSQIEGRFNALFS